MKKDELFYETVEELKKNGHFLCSNPELQNELYKHLKPEIPTLYKWEDKSFQYLNVIKKNDTSNITSLIEKREELKQEINEIDFILKHLGIDLNSD